MRTPDGFHANTHIRRKNYLLGLEFLIVGISASNFTTFIATGWQANYNIAIFLDAFSRGVGVPVIATLGLMAVTHDYKPSPAKDILIFVAGFAATGVYFLSGIIKGFLMLPPYSRPRPIRNKAPAQPLQPVA
ncbi:hypothetical protein AB2D15_34770, partial [Pseudomonas aeruginosa]